VLIGVRAEGTTCELSLDMLGLFSSFQSSTALINPDQNPTLFRSILCIIIKDVTDGDGDEIVGE
jgi:hypothetical protein